MAKKNKTHQCEGCGKKLSRSGYYKHRKTCDAYLGLESPSEDIEIKPVETVQFSEAPEESPTLEEGSKSENTATFEQEQQPDWFDFKVEDEEGVTENIPTALKMISTFAGSSTNRKPTEQEIQTMHDTNLNMLMLCLSGVDSTIQAYGRAVTMDKDLVVKHSDSDKLMTATAQYNWLLEKGINPSALVSTGTIAAAMTGYYIIPPVLKIRRRSKVRLFAGMAKGKVGGFMSRIPLIGRFFKRREVAQPVAVNHTGDNYEQRLN
jgi:hypothetical protein